MIPAIKPPTTIPPISRPVTKWPLAAPIIPPTTAQIIKAKHPGFMLPDELDEEEEVVMLDRDGEEGRGAGLEFDRKIDEEVEMLRLSHISLRERRF